MRFLIAALLAAAAVSSTAPAAKAAPAYDPYPWCAEYGGGRGGGGTNCYFMTWQQCMAALSGNGGLCRHNTFYTGPGGYYDEYSRHPRYRYRPS
jgi:Protein of unknown function (DUF3551)